MKKILYSIILMILPLSFNAQVQSPSNMKWVEINSHHARIIFPIEIEEQAQKAANLVDYMFQYQIKTINSEPKKIPIVLYNQSTYSNGFAGLMPRMSGWYMTPMQNTSDFGNTDWIYELSSHEFRHVFQYAKYNTGFTKFNSILFGQLGVVMGRYSVPYWFSEGDAICTETAFTGLGRGRVPQFNMHIRTMLINDEVPSYDIAKFRSYKTFYPSHYHLGWLLTSNSRINYGSDVWDTTIKSAMNLSFWPYAFSLSLKKHTGMNEKKLYDKTMNELSQKWKKDQNGLKLTDAKIKNKENIKDWTKYSELNFYKKNKILAVKTSMKGDISSFYILDDKGNESKLKATDAGMISYSDDKIVWSRRYNHPRWGLQDFSDIILFDIKTNKEKRLTKNQKLFAPSFSPDGKRIAATEYGSDLRSFIVILDSETGSLKEKISFKKNIFLRTPSWDATGKRIVFTATGRKGSFLKIFDTVSDSITFSVDFRHENISRPVFYKDYILYNSNYSGIDNIYSINIYSKEIFRITSRKYGAFNPKVQDDKMIFLDYSVNGYNIAETDLLETEWESISKINKHKFEAAEILTKQEQNKIVLDPDLIPDMKFKTSKYKKLKNALNIHSWGLSVSKPESYDLNDLKDFKPEIGLSLYSDDIMERISGLAEVKYNINEQNFRSDLTVNYMKYFTTFSIKGGWAQRTISYGDEYGTDNWEEWYTSVGTGLPLNFSEGIYFRRFQLNAAYSLLKKYHKREDIRYLTESGNGIFSYMTFSSSLYNLRRKANQDINPKFGQYISLRLKSTINTDNLSGNQLTAMGILYFPGLFKHHSTILKGGIELQREFNFNNREDYYWFGTSQFIPRGYGIVSIFDKFYTGQINYSFPVWYPDLNIGPLVHFKRVRANLFTDYAVSAFSTPYTKTKYLSSGIELYIQLYVFRLGEPIEIGGRISYLHTGDIDGKRIIPEFLVLGIPF